LTDWLDENKPKSLELLDSEKISQPCHIYGTIVSVSPIVIQNPLSKKGGGEKETGKYIFYFVEITNLSKRKSRSILFRGREFLR